MENAVVDIVGKMNAFLLVAMAISVAQAEDTPTGVTIRHETHRHFHCAGDDARGDVGARPGPATAEFAPSPMTVTAGSSAKHEMLRAVHLEKKEVVVDGGSAEVQMRGLAVKPQSSPRVQRRHLGIQDACG